jgi:hypothetical protein
MELVYFFEFIAYDAIEEVSYFIYLAKVLVLRMLDQRFNQKRKTAPFISQNL